MVFKWAIMEWKTNRYKKLKKYEKNNGYIYKGYGKTINVV